jgi:hypothetical protein
LKAIDVIPVTSYRLVFKVIRNIKSDSICIKTLSCDIQSQGQDNCR